MARRGDGDLAVTLACLASVTGGLVGAAFLLLLAPPLADVALADVPEAGVFARLSDWVSLFFADFFSSDSDG